ncbi:DUF6615 family protein [Shewanella algae]|uniref:DUF6615 family protein n=1 Tax=Shewanella algae TaxID=38313 RepID=UPI001BED778C|nr:DUF6615 family protein [Shewanella algae]BCV52918.1 hypothetical protein TUM17383_11650 [Shewanella algae]
MNICDIHKNINIDVCEFLKNVPSVKEESITDYLVWQWNKANLQIKHFDVATFTRDWESRVTGSDFELDIWFMTKSGGKVLSVQAKKLTKQKGGYALALRYKNNNKNQMDTLKQHAILNNKNACYAFYTVPDTSSKCKVSSLDISEFGVFIGNLTDIEPFTDKQIVQKKSGSAQVNQTVTKDMILEKTYPLHALFCASVPSVKSSLLPKKAPIPKLVMSLLNDSVITTQDLNNYCESETKCLPRHIVVIEVED